MDDWPVVFAITKKKVEKGTEIFGYYGEEFGDAMRTYLEKEKV